MGQLYTSGEWRTKEGTEAEFVEAWTALADWTIANVPGCTFAKLLQDESDSTHFVSFSPWRDADAVAAWRERPEFGQLVGRIQDLLDSFTPLTMQVASEVGPPTPDPR